jgi:hypothetical protein
MAKRHTPPATAPQPPGDTTPAATDTDTAHSEYIALRTGNQIAPERKAVIYSCADSLKMSPREIARRLKMDVRTVNAVLASRDSDAQSARNMLSANAIQFAQDWLQASEMGAKKGKHGPAKDALLHLKVIEPIQDNQTNVQVAIIVGAPGQPLQLTPPQVIDIKADND